MRQGVKDALADAKTLRLNDRRTRRTGRNVDCIDRWSKAARDYMGPTSTWDNYPGGPSGEVLADCARIMATKAAHVAHRAVPGLRGEALVERDRERLSTARWAKRIQRNKAWRARHADIFD